MLKEYRSFSPFRPLLCWKTSHACVVSKQLGLLTPLFMDTWTIHNMDGCWTCGWSEIQCCNLDLLMVCTASFVFVLFGPIYAMCFPWFVYTSHQFLYILIFPDLFSCVCMLTPWLCLYFCIEMPTKCVDCMCVALLLSTSMMYHSGFCSFLLFPFLPHPLLSPSSPSSCSLRLRNREKLNAGKRRRRLPSRNCTR